MSRLKRTKSSFKRDEEGRVILGTAKDMAAWVELGFEEQDKRKSDDIPFYKHFIDLRNCVLYISYPIGGKGEPASKIFNLCHMVGIVPGIDNLEGDSDYLYEVKLDIHLEGSVLFGNFFHYVKFDGMVKMDDATVIGTSSCFKCLFLSFVYMQGIHITGRSDYEQCEFRKGLVLTDSKSDLFHFNNCTIDERLLLSSVNLENHHNEGYHQSIEITNSSVENLSISSVNTNGLPIYMGDSKINGMHVDKLMLDSTLCFNSCVLDGIITFVKVEESTRNKFKEVKFHGCELKGQYHIENSDMEKFSFNFCNVCESGRLRLSQCIMEGFVAGCSTVSGQMDVTENEISEICLEGTCIQGFLNFQSNIIKKYSDRQTLCLLKNEARKVNDDVAAMQLYAKEMRLLLADNSISLWDKVSLWLTRLFSSFGENWGQALLVTFVLSVVLTLAMLGFGSTKYGFDLTGDFIGIKFFISTLLDSINVFSIPLFRDTIEEYRLNVWGQILYFVIKLVVAYGTYQFVVAFRKYVRR